MKISNSQNAIVDIQKLTEYCLNTSHPLGKHKAKIFAKTIGLTIKDSKYLKEKLLEAVKIKDAEFLYKDKFG